MDVGLDYYLGLSTHPDKNAPGRYRKRKHANEPRRDPERDHSTTRSERARSRATRTPIRRTTPSVEVPNGGDQWRPGRWRVGEEAEAGES